METEYELEPRKIPTQRRSKETVQAILEATAHVLKESGYAGATTNRIAEVAGVSIGSLYQYFPGKESLVYALNRQHIEEQVALLSILLTSADAPLPVLIRRLIRALVQAHTVDPDVHRAMTEQVLHLGLQHFFEAQQRARVVVQHILASRADEVALDNLEMAAWLLVTSAESAIHAALLEDPERLVDPVFEDELVTMLCRYINPERGTGA